MHVPTAGIPQDLVHEGFGVHRRLPAPATEVDERSFRRRCLSRISCRETDIEWMGAISTRSLAYPLPRRLIASGGWSLRGAVAAARAIRRVSNDTPPSRQRHQDFIVGISGALRPT